MGFIFFNSRNRIFCFFFLFFLVVFAGFFLRKVFCFGGSCSVTNSSPPLLLQDGSDDGFEGVGFPFSQDEIKAIESSDFTSNVNENGIDDVAPSFLNPDQITYEVDSFIPLSSTSLAYLVYHHPTNLTRQPTPLLPLDGEFNITRNSGIHLITTFFHGAYHSRRFHEIVATLVSNLENPYISNIHILYEGTDPRYFIPLTIQQRILQVGIQNKLVLTQVEQQPTYKEMFEYANKNLERGSIAIVSNADIYFDASLKCIYFLTRKTKIDVHTPGRPAFALTRRHSSECQLPDYSPYFDLCKTYIHSHDSFIFAPPLPKAILEKTDHTQNQGYGAENIVIYEFKKHRFQVSNPCFPIHGFHLHCSNERLYQPKLITKTRFGSSKPKISKCLGDGLAIY